MENKLEIYTNEEFGNIRTIQKGDKILFCGSDVAKALGYTNAPKALSDNCRYITSDYIPPPAVFEQDDQDVLHPGGGCLPADCEK